MIRLLHIGLDGSAQEKQLEHCPKNLPTRKDGTYWLDIYNEPEDHVRSILADIFKFNELSVEDALDQVHVPKIDNWEEYLYLTLHAPDFHGASDEVLRVDEIDAFYGSHYFLTYHAAENKTVNWVWEKTCRQKTKTNKGVAYLLYALTDALINEYMGIIDHLDEKIEQIEDDLLNDARQALLEKIFLLKRSLLTMRRIIAPFREIMSKLSRGDYALILSEDQMLFRDIYDHLVRLHDIIENLRELIGEALDTYLSVLNNRMNDIMRILTIITTLFMPLTFLTGFFGMNFFQPVDDFSTWTTHPSFLVLVVILIAFPLLMFLWMRGKKWM